jgi:hypothetical protein
VSPCATGALRVARGVLETCVRSKAYRLPRDLPNLHREGNSRCGSETNVETIFFTEVAYDR